MDTLTIVFLMGLLGGVHCLGMCGGVVALLTSALPAELRSNAKQTSLYHLNYNTGRILSYVLMGALFGLAGELLANTLKMSVLDHALRIFSGILMVLVGLYIANWYAGIQVLEKIGAKLWTKLQPISQKFLPVTSLKSAFLVGLFWGGIPCGLVYGALSFAVLSGSAVQGGLIMLAFVIINGRVFFKAERSYQKTFGEKILWRIDYYFGYLGFMGASQNINS